MYCAEFVCIFMPCAAIPVFLAGIVARLRHWNRAGGRGTTLFPVPGSPYRKWRRILVDALTFRELVEGDRIQWIGTWTFHASLFLSLFGHTRVVTDFPLPWRVLGLESARGERIAAAIGGALGILLLAAAAYILIRRLTVSRVREISGIEDYFTVMLVLALAASGTRMRFDPHFDLARVREFFSGLLSLKIAAVPRDPPFLLHFFLAQFLFMYFPFSKFLHIPGVFYSKSVLCGE